MDRPGPGDVEVREITDEDDLRTAARTDLASFGYPFDPREFDRTLALRRTARSYLALLGGEPAGAGLVHPFDMTVPGGAMVGLAGLGDVGVLPSHRRKGVLGSMMARMLEDAVRAGHVAAGLHASEATIYGRYGFGPATRHRKVSIDTRRAAIRSDAAVAGGRIEVLHPEDRAEVLRGVYDAALVRRGGEIRRRSEKWGVRLAGEDDQRDKQLCLAHRTPSGEWDGYALYTISARWQPAGPEHELEVVELVALDDAAELAVWQAVLGLDLVRSVVAWIPSDGLLLEALEDRWAPHSAGEHDGLWLRLLDVPAALSARRYRQDGALVLEVLDDRRPLGATTAGTWELAVTGGSASVTDASVGAATSGVDVRIGVGDLASVWLGGGSFGRLGAAGRLREHSEGALGRADAMFGWWPSPFITDFF